jgi:hypothetical protein
MLLISFNFQLNRHKKLKYPPNFSIICCQESKNMFQSIELDFSVYLNQKNIRNWKINSRHS